MLLRFADSFSLVLQASFSSFPSQYPFLSKAYDNVCDTPETRGNVTRTKIPYTVFLASETESFTVLPEPKVVFVEQEEPVYYCPQGFMDHDGFAFPPRVSDQPELPMPLRWMTESQVRLVEKAYAVLLPLSKKTRDVYYAGALGGHLLLERDRCTGTLFCWGIINRHMGRDSIVVVKSLRSKSINGSPVAMAKQRHQLLTPFFIIASPKEQVRRLISAALQISLPM